MISEKLLKNNELSKKLEKRVLSQVVVDYSKDKALNILTKLQADDFKYYRKIFEIIKESIENNSSFRTLLDDLFDKDKSLKYTDFLDIEFLVEREIDKAIEDLKRVSLFDKYLRKTSDSLSSASAKEIEGHISSYIGELAGLSLFKDSKIDSRQGIKNFEKNQEEFKNKKTEYLGISTGFKRIDEMTEGLIEGNLIVIGGYSGVGKTSFMLNVLLNVLKQGKRVVLYTLEMTADEIFAKLLAIESGINYVKILKGYLDEEELVKVEEAKAVIYETKLVTYDDFDDFEKIKMSMFKESMTEKVDLFVVDYLQLLSSEKYKTFYERISGVAKELKVIIAKKTNTPVIAISSISNADARSQSDEVGGYKGSGDIEYTANLAMKFLNIDDREKRDQNKTLRKSNYVDCVITKSRHSLTGPVQMSFNGYTGTYKEGRDIR